ncbi:MAG: TIGR00266 family protein [Lentisphaeria bacterium]|nr:TIGR00266 family protein [Lentisphaeria bacterium]
MKCKNCGTENDADAVFCELCGTKLGSQGYNISELDKYNRVSSVFSPPLDNLAEKDIDSKLFYEIYGGDLQFITFKLNKKQCLIAQPGAMTYMDENVEMTTSCDDGSNPDAGFWELLGSAAARFLAGESFFLTHFSGKNSDSYGEVSFSSPYPGKIVPVNLKEHNSAILCQRSAFLAASAGTKIKIAFATNFGSGLFGGTGFILQHLVGNGMAFIHSCGEIKELKLENQTIRVNPGCIVAFDESIKYNITPAGDLTTMFYGTRSVFLATLSGTGSVWIQSMPFNLLANRICCEGIRQGLFENKNEEKTPRASDFMINLGLDHPKFCAACEYFTGRREISTNSHDEVIVWATRDQCLCSKNRKNTYATSGDGCWDYKEVTD